MFSFKKQKKKIQSKRLKTVKVQLSTGTSRVSWVNLYTIDFFLPVLEYTPIFFFLKENNAPQSHFFYIHYQFWLYLAFLLCRNTSSSIFTFCVDLLGFWKSQYYEIFLTLANFTTLYRTTLITRLNTAEVSLLSSLTSVLRGVAWLEREVRELDGIFFYGLRDTRRLLQDYFVSPQAVYGYDSYVTAGYSHVAQQVLSVKLNFLF